MVRYSNARSFGMIRIRSYARLVQTLRSSRVVGTWTYDVDMAHMAPGMAPRPGVVAPARLPLVVFATSRALQPSAECTCYAEGQEREVLTR